MYWTSRRFRGSDSCITALAYQGERGARLDVTSASFNLIFIVSATFKLQCAIFCPEASWTSSVHYLHAYLFLFAPLRLAWPCPPRPSLPLSSSAFDMNQRAVSSYSRYRGCGANLEDRMEICVVSAFDTKVTMNFNFDFDVQSTGPRRNINSTCVNNFVESLGGCVLFGTNNTHITISR